MQGEEVPANVMLIDAVPHDWLFPRCKAVIHHGGAGTTAAGLFAACPTTVVPFFGDQSFWSAICSACCNAVLLHICLLWSVMDTVLLQTRDCQVLRCLSNMFVEIICGIVKHAVVRYLQYACMHHSRQMNWCARSHG